MLPLEFVVVGVPASSQTRNMERKRLWVGQVRDAALAAAAASGLTSPVEEPVLAKVSYFGRGRANLPDRDNMAKPILDALQGIVYTNDRLVRRVTAELFSIDERFIVAGISLVLAQAFSNNMPFVHVKIDLLSSQPELP